MVRNKFRTKNEQNQPQRLGRNLKGFSHADSAVYSVGIAVLENYITLPFSFWTPFGWTMGMVSLLVAFLIPFNFCEKKRLRKQRLIAGCTGLILFLISITPEVVAEGQAGFGSSALGAGGMFCAIVTGLIVCIVFNAFGKFSFFKEDSAIPDFVRQWFDALLPIGLVIFGGFIVVQVLNINLYQIVSSIFMPLQTVMNTWYGFILINFLTCFIYSMGISSWVLTPVTEPVKLAGIAANIAMVAAGKGGFVKHVYGNPGLRHVYVVGWYRLHHAAGSVLDAFQSQEAESFRPSLHRSGNLQHQ